MNIWDVEHIAQCDLIVLGIGDDYSTYANLICCRFISKAYSAFDWSVIFEIRSMRCDIVRRARALTLKTDATGPHILFPLAPAVSLPSFTSVVALL